MNKAFLLNPALSDVGLLDAISERLVKAEAVANCLLAIDYTISQSSEKTIYHIIWVISDYLAEINVLVEKLFEK